ncbi:hypothetical protein [Estrella lausannensis]|uniref:Uncharacterized protein n=1 Tax=Estrella lausannensis TaxID=483423 RepID=A0A0H5DPC7_9BACT|nr:hypothetical protein [Estrella lausannensis]CRX37813.1 conserved hypothetical protein [Estrella lausannensis]
MFYRDYVWIKGKPQGRENPPGQQLDTTSRYKIVRDPYGKRHSVELYKDGKFQGIIYDSHLFDFRLCVSKMESSWQKIDAELVDHHPASLIRDQDDRTIAEERYIFAHGLCTECHIHYPGGPLVAVQKMFYEGASEEPSAVALFDQHFKPVGIKIFGSEAPEKGFTCTYESWDMTDEAALEKLDALFKETLPKGDR